MKNWLDTNIQINNAPIHYYRTGGKKPPLLLVHGFTSSALCWVQVAQTLEADFDIIMPDIRGHGLSARIKPGEKVDGAADLVTLINSLGLKDVILVGHSMGAVLVAEVAAQHPNLIKKLILDDPPWQKTSESLLDSQSLAERREALKKMQDQGYERLIATCQAEHPTWAKAELDGWAKAKLQFDLNIFESNLSIASWQNVIPHITCPILLITGDLELGAMVDPETAQKIASTWHNGQVVCIKGAGHSARREQFDAYMTIVKAFL